MKKKKQIVWAIVLTVSIVLFFLTGCGSKKTTSKTQKKENTEVNLIDSSKINKKIEVEKQFVDTQTKERIVTLYGVRFDTIYIENKPYIIPSSFPLKKEENRGISTQNFLYKLSVRDSIEKAIDLKYKTKIDEKENKISELKESTMVYQITLLVVSIIAFILVVLYNI